MDKNELIASFQDTLNFSYSASLYEATIKAQQSNRVYKESFAFKHKKLANIFISDSEVYEVGNTIVEKNTTFTEAVISLRACNLGTNDWAFGTQL